MNNYNKKTVAEKRHTLVESKSFIMFVGLLFFGVPVFSHNPDIQNCVSITDPVARLLCYDAVFQDTQKIDKSEKVQKTPIVKNQITQIKMIMVWKNQKMIYQSQQK